MGKRTPRRDASGHVDPFHQRRKRYEAALRPLGLAQAFAAMPRAAQEMFFKRKMPDLMPEFDESIPADEYREATRAALDRMLRAISIEINGTAIPVRDFFAVLEACLQFVQLIEPAMLAKMPDAVRRFFDLARPVLLRCHEDHQRDAIYAIIKPLFNGVTANSRLETQLLYSRMTFEPTAKGKITPRVVLGAEKPQVRDVTIDGQTRPMYRVAAVTGGEVKWIAWKTAELGLDAAPGEKPLYVQAHALRQLAARVNLPPAAPYLQAWLAESLAQPNIVERNGKHLLVEFRLTTHRLGYLVVTPLKEVVAVRTFLFLTMQATPEGRALEKRLRLQRREVDWLGLTELTAFTQTDLRDDPQLRRMMEKCGCGHLFELEKAEGDFAPAAKPLAAEMRKYLRLAA